MTTNEPINWRGAGYYAAEYHGQDIAGRSVYWSVFCGTDQHEAIEHARRNGLGTPGWYDTPEGRNPPPLLTPKQLADDRANYTARATERDAQRLAWYANRRAYRQRDRETHLEALAKMKAAREDMVEEQLK